MINPVVVHELVKKVALAGKMPEYIRPFFTLSPTIMVGVPLW